MGKSILEAWERKAQLPTILHNYEYKYAVGASVSDIYPGPISLVESCLSSTHGV